MTKSKKYDLEERTAKFAEEIVEFWELVVDSWASSTFF
jgi:hypothetical protein